MTRARYRTAMTWRQLLVLALLIIAYAMLVVAAFLLFPGEPMQPTQPMAAPTESGSPWQLGIANALVVFVVYGPLGIVGLWFARRLGLPGVYREGAGWRAWLLQPALTGLFVGVVIVVVDRLFALSGTWGGFAHPAFPLSLVASATAGIGEEIMFRSFVLGLWAFVLGLLVGRRLVAGFALWTANLLAALLFAVAHLPAVMLLLGASSPAEVPPLVLAELFLLNGILGLVAGERYIREGLVAAVGVHFWADIVWHVLWPLLGLAA